MGMGGKGGGGKGGGTSVNSDVFQYLQMLNSQNQQRMMQTYKNLGLDTSGEAMGMSPQESTDLNWLQQGAHGVGTQLAQANAPLQLAANQANLSQAAQGLQQSQQAASSAGTIGGSQADTSPGSSNTPLY